MDRMTQETVTMTKFQLHQIACAESAERRADREEPYSVAMAAAFRKIAAAHRKAAGFASEKAFKAATA